MLKKKKTLWHFKFSNHSNKEMDTCGLDYKYPSHEIFSCSLHTPHETLQLLYIMQKFYHSYFMLSDTIIHISMKSSPWPSTSLLHTTTLVYFVTSPILSILSMCSYHLIILYSLIVKWSAHTTPFTTFIFFTLSLLPTFHTHLCFLLLLLSIYHNHAT